MDLNACISLLLTMSSPKRTGKTHFNHHGNRPIGADESALWEEVTKSIMPMSLKNNSSVINPTEGPEKTTKKIQRRFIDLPIAPQPCRPTKPSFQHGKAPGLDRKTQTRMRRGQVQLESRIDLHGMTQTIAHRALLNFLERAYHEGRRSVLVITGKGLSPDGEIGVLRRAVPAWLNEPPMSTWIKGFDYAARQHGGEGALYVLIRRRR
jgi:DNA-nicking Smr family endonuclease